MIETGEGIVSILPVDELIWTPPPEQLVEGGGAVPPTAIRPQR